MQLANPVGISSDLFLVEITDLNLSGLKNHFVTRKPVYCNQFIDSSFSTFIRSLNGRKLMNENDERKHFLCHKRNH